MSPLLDTIPADSKQGAELSREEFQALDPAQETGWEKFISSYPSCSFAHSAAWAEVLSKTYSHKPYYIAIGTEKRKWALLPLMEVNSPLTGRRGVSLPFTDHCPPLCAEPALAAKLFQEAINRGRVRKWRFLEIRGWEDLPAGSRPSVSYFGHRLDLEDGPDVLFGRFHPSIRRGVRKAQNEGVRFEISSSFESVKGFYRLHCLTRKKHGAPPQPFRFFENVFQNLLSKGLGIIVTATIGQKPVAAAMFFHGASNATYKYGASDPAYQVSRGNNVVMWEAIRWYSSQGYESLDFGRTSEANEGLRRFKRGWGAREFRIDYARYDFAHEAFARAGDGADGWHTRVLACLPVPILRAIGALLYPHLS